MPRKAEMPTKGCPVCGEAFTRKRWAGRLEDMARFRTRVHCSTTCMGKSMMKDDPTRSAYQRRIRHLRGPQCERCGKASDLHLHHKNRDWRDNRPENLETLCATCHLKHHHANGDILGQ